MANSNDPMRQVLGTDGNKSLSFPRFIWLSRLPGHMTHHPGTPVNCKHMRSATAASMR